MSLRIQTSGPQVAMQPVAAGAQAAPPKVDKNTYLERLVKLVPAETIGAYSVLKATTHGQWWELLTVAWSLLLVTGLIRWHESRDPANNIPPQWPMVAIAMFSFFIWVQVMGGSFGVVFIAELISETLAQALIGSEEFLAILFMVLWTIIVPYLYKCD